MRRLACTLAMVLGSVAPALAASGAREDNSGIFVWLFLGFCALIIVAQLVPAVLTMIGMAKGVADMAKEKREVTVKH